MVCTINRLGRLYPYIITGMETADKKHDLVAPVSPVSPLANTVFVTPPNSPSSLKVNEQKNSRTPSPTLPPKPKGMIF